MAQMTTLAAAITTTGQSSITITEHVGFPAAGAFSILIDSEVLRVTAGNGTTGWTVTRGYASTTAATHTSGTTVALVSDGSVINLGMVKTWGDIDDSTEDAWAQLLIDAINRAIIRDIGVDLGPSQDTTRTFRVRDHVRCDGTRLYIPGGIRAFSAVATGDGTTWTTVTTSCEVGPTSHLRSPGEPGAYIEVLPEATIRLDDSYYVRVTATAGEGFGWDEWPADIAQVAQVAFTRARAERAMGGAEIPTESTVSRYIKWDADLLRRYRWMYFPPVA